MIPERRSDEATERRRASAPRPTSLGRLVASSLSLALLAGPASAQQSAPGKDPLASKEEIVRDRVMQLEDRMFRLIEKLGQTEPDQAERLRVALHACRELRIRQQIEELVKLLDGGQLVEATDRQKLLVRDLQAVLRRLLENSIDPQARQKELDLLKAIRGRIADLLAEERDHRKASDLAARSAELRRTLDDAARAIESLIRRERAAVDRTDAAIRAGGVDGTAMQTDQAGIRAETEKLAEQLARLAAASQPASTRPARAATRPADGAAESPPALERTREHMERAVARMKDAEAPLGEGRFEQARAAQTRSIESLREALRELREQAEALRKSPDLPAMARGQRETASRTGKLADDMAGGSEAGPTSRPGDGEPGARQGQPPPAVPGRENIEQARQQMDGAADDLKDNRPGDANTKQQEAIRQLIEAQKHLEEQLNQLRREQQEEVLRALEDRFRDMLARQLQVNQNTLDLDRKGMPNWTRTEELLAGTLAQAERDLAAEAGTALTILREEGTSLVFPRIVEQLAADLNDAGGRIAEKDVGPATQQVQADIVESLKELIEAVEQVRKKGAGGSVADGSGGQQQTPPLLPPSAELKLLRACQVRVNRQTEAFAKDRGNEQTLTPDQQRSLRRIAERQKEVAAMAQEMNERTQR
ncbi:MAG: hypothetical protein ACPMAQ_15330 [Phycisphaerae bacterium]